MGGAVIVSTAFRKDSALGLPCEFFINQKSKYQIIKIKTEEVTLMPSGGYRPGAGRPRKNPIDKKLEGKAAKSVSRTPVAAPTVKPKKVNSAHLMTDYFSMAMKECEKEVPSADVLRTEIEDYISARGCDGFVAPQTVTDYVLNRQGFLACECMNRKIGRMTKDLKLSPYVTAGAQYYKAMQADFNLITQIINRHSNSGGEETNEFLQLLMNRGF
jgi:hypothetical protein